MMRTIDYQQETNRLQAGRESNSTDDTTNAADLIEVFDATILNERLEDDQDLVAIVLDAFREDAGNEIAMINKSIEDKKSEAVRFHAHTLKGAAGNVGALEIERLARKIQHLCDHREIDAVSALIPRLDQAYSQFLAAMDACKK